MDKSLFFLVLAICCVWLVVDEILGKHYITNFLASLFPFMREG